MRTQRRTKGKFALLTLALTAAALGPSGFSPAFAGWNHATTRVATPPPIRAATALTNCHGSWSSVPSPSSSGNNNFNAVAPITANDIWAVGSETNNAGVLQTLTQHWDGGAWTIVSSPDLGLGSGDNALNSIAAVSSNDVWAVGAGRADQNSPLGTLTEHWNGTSWSTVTSPNGAGTASSLSSVKGDASNDVWAVGRTLTATSSHPLAELWNGASWTLTSPVSAQAYSDFNAVKVLSSTDVWAVGSQSSDDLNFRPLIEHWTGAVNGWSVVTAANSVLGDGFLLGIDGTGPNDIWAVGGAPSTGFDLAMVEHWDGSSWTNVGNVPTGSDTDLNSVVAISASNVWAVGTNFGGTAQAPADRTVVEHWDGASWGAVSSPNVGSSSDLFDVAALSASDVWAVGFWDTANQSEQTLAMNYCVQPTVTSVSPTSGPENGGTNVTISGTGLVWTTGVNFGSAAASNVTVVSDGTVTATSPTGTVGAVDVRVSYFAGMSAPSSGDRFTYLVSPPTVAGVVPITGNPGGGNDVLISGTNFISTTGVNFGATPATRFQVNSNTQITATVPAGSAVGRVDVTVTNTAGTSATSAADSYVYVPAAISWQQYSLSGSDGTSWQPVDATNLSLTVTAPVQSQLLVTANADLWTANAGVNQDIGLMITGGRFAGSNRLLGWKESGGFAGTFSPNAAALQAMVSEDSSETFTVTLVWKANKATSGTIFMGAGGPAFSPTRLTAEVIPQSPNIGSPFVTTQATLTGSNGTSWSDVGSLGMSILYYTPAANGTALLSGNADLWTTVAGVNQDLGIWITGGAFGPTGQLIGWKESGGFAGTFSPNAAFVQVPVQLVGGQTYNFKLVWKANKPTSGTIVMGAGPLPDGTFSPTRLTLHFFPAGTGLSDAISTQQYSRAGSTGSDWQPVDATNLQIEVTPTSASNWILNANADLWTATAGVNQDLGIFISGGAFGSGTLVAWKESGGFAGTFSPNAAFVETVLPLASGVTYTITPEWKANKATNGTIFMGAGPWPSISSNFSPTSITAQQTN